MVELKRVYRPVRRSAPITTAIRILTPESTYPSALALARVVLARTKEVVALLIIRDTAEVAFLISFLINFIISYFLSFLSCLVLTLVIEEFLNSLSYSGHNGGVEEGVKTREKKCADYYSDQDLNTGIDVSFCFDTGNNFARIAENRCCLA